MAVGNYQSYQDPYEEISTSGTYGQIWNTVLDEYNDPDWFSNQIYAPFSDQFSGPLMKMEFQNPTSLLDAYQGLFPPFETSDWEYLDKMHNIATSQLDRNLQQIQQDRVESREFEEEVYNEKKNIAISRADKELEQVLERQAYEEYQLAQEYESTMSELNNMISRTGLESGYVEQKRNIQLENVAANINQANFTKVLATEEANRKKDRALEDYEDSLAMSDLLFDQQYETAFQTGTNKEKALHAKLIKDKLNVYDQWKTGTVSNLTRLVSSGAAEYDIDAWEIGGEYAEDGTFTEKIYSYEEYQQMGLHEQASMMAIGCTIPGASADEGGSSCQYIKVGEALQDQMEMYNDWTGNAPGHQSAQNWGDGGYEGYIQNEIIHNDRDDGHANGFEKWKAENPELYEHYVNQFYNEDVSSRAVGPAWKQDHENDVQGYSRLMNFIYDQVHLQPVRAAIAEQESRFDFSEREASGELYNYGDYGVHMPMTIWTNDMHYADRSAFTILRTDWLNYDLTLDKNYITRDPIDHKYERDNR